MGKNQKGVGARYKELLSKTEDELRAMAADPVTRARVQKFLRIRAQLTFNKRMYKIEQQNPNKPGRRLHRPNMKNWDGRGGI